MEHLHIDGDKAHLHSPQLLKAQRWSYYLPLIVQTQALCLIFIESFIITEEQYGLMCRHGLIQV